MSQFNGCPCNSVSTLFFLPEFPDFFETFGSDLRDWNRSWTDDGQAGSWGSTVGFVQRKDSARCSFDKAFVPQQGPGWYDTEMAIRWQFVMESTFFKVF